MDPQHSQQQNRTALQQIVDEAVAASLEQASIEIAGRAALRFGDTPPDWTARQGELQRQLSDHLYVWARANVDVDDELPADDGQQAHERGPVPAGCCCWAYIRSGGAYHEGTCTAATRRATVRATS